MAGLFDVRGQQWRTVMVQLDPRQNEKVLAPERVEDLTAGTLVVADLGYSSASPGLTGSQTGAATG